MKVPKRKNKMAGLINLVVEVFQIIIYSSGGVNITIGMALAGYLIFELGIYVFQTVAEYQGSRDFDQWDSSPDRFDHE